MSFIKPNSNCPVCKGVGYITPRYDYSDSPPAFIGWTDCPGPYCTLEQLFGITDPKKNDHKPA